MCGLGKPDGGCSLALHWNGDEEGKCRNCGGGRPEIPSIGTVEAKAKRPRWTYVPHVLRGEAFDSERAADGRTAAAVAYDTAATAAAVAYDATTSAATAASAAVVPAAAAVAAAAAPVDSRQFR